MIKLEVLKFHKPLFLNKNNKWKDFRRNGEFSYFKGLTKFYLPPSLKFDRGNF